MDRYEYLTAGNVLALHEAIMRDTGEAAALLRDVGLLESAVMRPQMAAHYENADLVTQAAYLVAGIALAHPFVDGNKRTAMLAGEAFLRLNGRRYSGEAMDLARQIEDLTTAADRHDTGISRLAEWLRPYLQELP